VIDLTAGDIVDDFAVVQIFWRRRDPHPEVKAVLVSDAAGVPVSVVSSSISGDCGVVNFTRPNLAAGLFYAYYLPYAQGGGGAGLEFSWGGCASEDPTAANPCVGGRRSLAATPGDSQCGAATSAAIPVVGLENRDGFNAFTAMEQMATSDESARAAAALASGGVQTWVGAFPEDARLSVRVFDAGIPSRWALAASPAAQNPAFAAAAAPGQWLAFQVGLWAYAAAVSNVSAAFTDAAALDGSATIPAAAFTVINLAGFDTEGAPFANTAYGLPQGGVGSLWCGFDIPAGTAPGVYTSKISLSAAQSSGSALTINLTFNISGAAVPDNGADDIFSMARLSWLNSRRGLEDTVPLPFVPVSSTIKNGSLVVASLRKSVTLTPEGLPGTALVDFERVRGGVPATTTHSLFSSAVTFDVYADASATAPLAPYITQPAAISQTTASAVSWTSTWTVAAPGGNVSLSLTGELDFTSTLTFAVTLLSASSESVSIGDVRLRVPVDPLLAAQGYIVGMSNSGAEATRYADRQWRWTNTTGANKVYVGHPEAAVLVNLKGDGVAWDSPMFGADYPIIPSVPPTWGGVDALPESNPFGVNVTNGTVLAFSGPRTLPASGQSTTFRFALQLLPSKAINWTAHWASRTQQLGYDVPYASPAEVAARGVTVVTLHQGTGGVINGSLINPWINYPFLGADAPANGTTVPFLTNFTAQSNALGMATKFYYTVRELSSRAPEMFAFKALQGEVLVDEDPWTIVQPGYAHRWNTHGGAAFLHQHMVTHYGACWQQTETNGEIDPSMCTHGVSRLFNYYVEGLAWSMSHAPFINGIYYDGTNFARSSMIRIRRAADAAALAAGGRFRAFLDLHTGREGTPDTCSYASHYPLMDSIWNGEGFDFGAAPPYWLIEISGNAHGLSGDMLGSGERSVWRGLVFGMTQRDAVSSQAIWRMWDAVRIDEASAMFAWWELDGHAVNATAQFSSAAFSTACSFTMTRGAYPSSANEQCLQPSGPTPGCWSVNYDLQTVEAACCADAACAGFSYAHDGSGLGCCKASQDGVSKDASYDGYYKVGWKPVPPGGINCALSTVFSSYGSHAVVFLASFCGEAVNVTLSVDWDALGLDSATALVSLPGIDGVQSPQSLESATGPFSIGADGGLAMLIQKKA
jgi:hypothetical protein